MRQFSKFVLGAAVLFAGACGGGGETSAESGGTASSGGGETAASALAPADACVAMMTRERTCQADVLPGLVALRVRLDLPPGIAARDASEGRDALVAEATGEFARDMSDENIAANCAQVAEMPAAWADAMNACLDAAECGAFAECDARFTEMRMSGPH